MNLRTPPCRARSRRRAVARVLTARMSSAAAGKLRYWSDWARWITVSTEGNVSIAVWCARSQGRGVAPAAHEVPGRSKQKSSWPRSMSSDVKREPINPVAPVNKIRIGFLGIRDPEYCHQNWDVPSESQWLQALGKADIEHFKGTLGLPVLRGWGASMTPAAAQDQHRTQTLLLGN